MAGARNGQKAKHTFTLVTFSIFRNCLPRNARCSKMGSNEATHALSALNDILEEVLLVLRYISFDFDFAKTRPQWVYHLSASCFDRIVVEF